ncbi:hypothetical protein C2G38_2177767 [Gigaspora rosea]|uniref:Uncharacterized protein n=1 Tax=Gigaspora rosea TaxID=44941 RepID=A0A397VEW6_9GLOM|nr:hypothetical protein C2G38_2177767 [Gigaspora rosea]
MHEIYRNVAIDSLKRYCDNMKAQLNKMNIKFTTEYQISDLNMIEYTVIVWYLYARYKKQYVPNRIGYKSGFLEIVYNAAEILPLGFKQFLELDNIPLKV